MIEEFITLCVAHPWFAALWALFGILVSSIVNHFLAIDRDNGHDFNRIAETARGILAKEKAALIGFAGLDDEIIGSIHFHLGWRDKARFTDAIAAYRAAKSKISEDEIGQPFYGDPEAIKAAIDDLLPFVKKR